MALLEGGELLSRALGRAALTVAGILLAVAAWLAGAGALVLFVMPDTNPVVRLAVLALLNGGAGLGLVALAGRDTVGRLRVGRYQSIKGRAMSTTDFAEQRDDLLRSIEREREVVRVAVHELTGAAQSKLSIGERIEKYPLS